MVSQETWLKWDNAGGIVTENFCKISGKLVFRLQWKIHYEKENKKKKDFLSLVKLL